MSQTRGNVALKIRKLREYCSRDFSYAADLCKFVQLGIIEPADISKRLNLSVGPEPIYLDASGT